MAKLGDRAGAPDTEVVLAPETAGLYRLQNMSIVASEDIGEPGGFPEFGQFVRVDRMDIRDGEFVVGDEALLELPLYLEQELVKQNVEGQPIFSIAQPRKAEGGRWIMDVDVPDDPRDLL